MVSKYIYMRKMLSFREVYILLPFVATFPAQNNLSLLSLNNRPTKEQNAQNQTFPMEKFILACEGGDGGILETCSPHCVQGLVTITSVFSLCPCSDDDDDDAGSLDILMEAPEGFRNSDEECFSESQVNQNENLKPVV